MLPFEFLYRRRCKSPLCWEDVRDTAITGPEIVQQTAEKVKQIRERLRVAQNRQKYQAYTKRRPLEFVVGEKVFLKVSPSRGINRFVVKGKLSPRYVGPFEIVERIGDFSYRFLLPEVLVGVHNVFHISQLRRYIADPSYVVKSTKVRLEAELTYEEEPVGILDKREKVLKNKTITLVRVAWKHQLLEDNT